MVQLVDYKHNEQAEVLKMVLMGSIAGAICPLSPPRFLAIYCPVKASSAKKSFNKDSKTAQQDKILYTT